MFSIDLKPGGLMSMYLPDELSEIYWWTKIALQAWFKKPGVSMVGRPALSTFGIISLPFSPLASPLDSSPIPSRSSGTTEVCLPLGSPLRGKSQQA